MLPLPSSAQVRRQCAEEKQHLLVEASKQMRESVATVKTEMEGRIAQAQAIAVQEAIKEVNTQSNSKEVSIVVSPHILHHWHCTIACSVYHW